MTLSPVMAWCAAVHFTSTCLPRFFIFLAPRPAYEFAHAPSCARKKGLSGRVLVRLRFRPAWSSEGRPALLLSRKRPSLDVRQPPSPSQLLPSQQQASFHDLSLDREVSSTNRKKKFRQLGSGVKRTQKPSSAFFSLLFRFCGVRLPKIRWHSLSLSN